MASEVFDWREAPPADFAVIGDPVSHSLSPVMHQAAYNALGLPHRYVAVRVEPSSVPNALEHLRTLGYRGVNVTVPHKEEALGWCNDVDAFSRRVRAVNTLSLEDRLGINTDGPGFMDTIPSISRALVLGAGGSARSIALALSEAGVELAISNRTGSRAEDLLLQLGIDAAILSNPVAKGFDLIVNTTSASLQGASIEIDWSGAEGAFAYDLMYSREPTPFLKAAREAGLRTMDGLPLLVAQGARSFAWWLGTEPPRDVMMQAVETAMKSN